MGRGPLIQLMFATFSVSSREHTRTFILAHTYMIDELLIFHIVYTELNRIFCVLGEDAIGGIHKIDLAGD